MSCQNSTFHTDTPGYQMVNVFTKNNFVFQFIEGLEDNWSRQSLFRQKRDYDDYDDMMYTYNGRNMAIPSAAGILAGGIWTILFIGGILNTMPGRNI